MKRAGSWSLVVGSFLALSTASTAEDAERAVSFTPVQLAIAPGPAQIFSKVTAVYGLRVNLIYGIQDDVVGLDAGIFNEVDSQLTGMGIGICNLSRRNATGMHLGVGCNFVNDDFAGFQLGIVNFVGGHLAGFQLAATNEAATGAGFQLGILNRSRSLRGLQIGLFNFNESGLLPFLPILNIGY